MPRVAVTVGNLSVPPSNFIVDYLPIQGSAWQASVSCIKLTNRSGIPPGIPLTVGTSSSLRYLYATKPALVHQHWATWSRMATTYSRSAGVPLVLSIHGYDAFLPKSEGRLSIVKDFVKSGDRSSAIQVASMIVVNSDFIKNQILALGVDPEKVVVIRHGIDLSKYQISDGGDRDGLLYVGRLSPEKGPDLLLKAFEILSDNYRTKLTVVGAGSMDAECRKFVRDRNLNVDFLGAKSRPEVISLIQKSEAVVCPSVWSGGRAEASGIVPLEAQACGTSVIATNVGGLPEGISPLLHDLISEPNPQSLSEKMQSALVEESPCQRSLRAHIAKYHSLGQSVLELESLYDRCVGRS